MLTNTKTKSIEIAILCLSIASFGTQPVSILHSINSCTVDGPTATLNLTLQIVNNTTTVLSGAEITTAPMGPLETGLGLIFEQVAMQVGDIPAEGVVSVDYTIESAYALPEEAIGHLPVFWEVGYIDETGQQQMTVVRSVTPFSEPQVTTETASAAVASLSGSCVIAKWIARYDGPASNSDQAHAMAVDPEGNVYVTGRSFSSDTKDDYATVKYDPSGNELWVGRYNGPENSSDNPWAIALDPEGNVYVTGESHGSTYNDYATVKYNASGNELWVARYNGSANYNDWAYAIAVDSSGNVYVTGESNCSYYNRDYATVKYDSSGNELWVVRYNGPANRNDLARAIAVDSSGNVYVTGISSGGVNNSDYATVKYDINGNQLWVARYSPTNYSINHASNIALDAWGNVYVTGKSGSDYATVKYDKNGNQLWVARYNGPGNSVDYATAIAIDFQGNVYVTGQSYGNGTNSDYATIKYDSSGNQLWVERYDGPENSYDHACAMALDASGNVYVTGRSSGGVDNSDYATVKYDSSGNELWVARYNGPENDYDQPYAIAVDISGNVYVTGYSYGSGTWADYVTIKYISVEDPSAAIEALVAAVVSLNLQQGITNSLDAKLGAALNALDDVNANNDAAAINTMVSFINAVEAQRGKEISEPDADGLIQAAVNIINMLNGS